MSASAGPPPAAIPATLVTGFLGSGKTTLLNRLLAHPAMSETAVIVNEFGEIGLDHLLIETAFEDAVLLKSGCVCCTVRGDLVDTLRTMFDRRERGEIPRFRRVAIETTGLADPAPILHLLMADPAVTRNYRVEAVITTVDAVNADAQLAAHYESAKQAALADRLVLTKTDLAAPDAAARLTARLRALNPGAPILSVVEGQVDPDLLFGGPDARPPAADMAGWLLAHGTPRHEHAHDDTPEHQARHHGIASFCLVRDEPVPWPALKAWLVSLASLRGPDLLRMKGVVNVAGRDGPVVIHGVQHVFHPPRQLARWPDEDHRTRVVFITRNIDEASLRRSFAASLGQA